MEFLENALFEPIYGPAALGLLFIGIGYLLSKRSSRAASATYVLAGLLIFIGFAVFPTYPRYKFEKETLSQLYQDPLEYVANRTPWGAITEPLTWFLDFTGSFHVVTFHSRLDALAISKDLTVPRQFVSVFLRYKEEPSVSMIKVFCDAREYFRSVLDTEGVFRSETLDWQKMDDRMYQVYCAYDWLSHVQKALESTKKSTEPRQTRQSPVK